MATDNCGVGFIAVGFGTVCWAIARSIGKVGLDIAGAAIRDGRPTFRPDPSFPLVACLK
ncbi:MAG: hypothetical protein GY945_05760 [Rhodobacteraceae bacterium]|nr:hypothetical protein [Paracoccaceae bacterium]